MIEENANTSTFKTYEKKINEKLKLSTFNYVYHQKTRFDTMQNLMNALLLRF